jgi:hypothetical protein
MLSVCSLVVMSHRDLELIQGEIQLTIGDRYDRSTL